MDDYLGWGINGWGDGWHIALGDGWGNGNEDSKTNGDGYGNGIQESNGLKNSQKIGWDHGNGYSTTLINFKQI